MRVACSRQSKQTLGLARTAGRQWTLQHFGVAFPVASAALALRMRNEHAMLICSQVWVRKWEREQPGSFERYACKRIF